MSSYVLDAPLLAQTSQYIEPARAKIEIWDYPKQNLLYYYNSFDPGTSAILPTFVSVDIGMGQAGTFSLTIPDPDKTIPPSVLRRKNTVIISAKKYFNDPWDPLIYGFVEKLGHFRDRSSLLEYVLTGLGSGALLNHRIVNFARTARRATIDSSLAIHTDPRMQGRRLYRDLLSDSSSYLIPDQTLEEQGGYDMSLLDVSEVTSELASIDHQGVQASQVFNTIVEGIGAEGGVNALNQPFLKYPTGRHSGIVLKTLKPEEKLKDRAENTSYFLGSWNYEIDWSKDSGFTNRIFSKAKSQSEDSTVTTGGNTAGSTSLADIDLAVKIPPNVSKFADLSVIVSRKGEGKDPRSTVNTLHGHIVEDLNGFPNGAIRARFDIPLTSIPTTATPIFLGNAVIIGRVDTSKEHWIILYDRGKDSNDTIFWHTVAGTDGTIASRLHFADSPWARDHNIGTGWEVRPNTFKYAFSIFDSFTIPIIAEDTDSQERFGLVESTLEVPWANSANSANKYLHEKLWWSSMPKIVFQANTVTIPNKLFHPGDFIQIVDELSDLPASDNITAQVVDVRYDFGGNDAFGSLGAAICSLTPLGFYDFRAEGDVC